MEQRRRFERALTGAEDRDSLAGEAAQIRVVERMRNQRRREMSKLRRTVGERADAGRHHDAPRVEFLAIGEAHAEPLRVGREMGDCTSIQVRYRLLLKPLPVADKVFDRDGLGRRNAMQ